jgi:hypothetical protein
MIPSGSHPDLAGDPRAVNHYLLEYSAMVLSIHEQRGS